MVTVLAVCVIVGMCLGFLLVYVLSSGRKPISSAKATEVSRSFSEGSPTAATSTSFAAESASEARPSGIS